MSKAEKDVKISKAKGRPMLTWVGKRPLDRVKAYPAQHIETFAVKDPPPDALAECDWSDWPDRFPRGGLLFHGDNKDVLAYLLANGFRGKVKLIYIDPPFDSGADYVRKVELRGKQKTAKIEGEEYTLGEQIQYTDIWANDNYLQFMYERLMLLRELLSDDGAIAVHCDHNVNFLIRSLLEEIFGGGGNFVNEVVWQHAVIGAGRGIYVRLPKAHESIYLYKKGERCDFNTDSPNVRVPYKERITKNLSKDENGYFYTRGRTGTDNPWSREPKYLKTYVDIEKGKLVHDIWDDITTYRAQGDEYLGFPTQKPEELIARIVSLLSSSSDIVLDCFIGSGTTAAVAQKLGRRWIGCDINKGAIQTTAKRLQKAMAEQVAATDKPKQRKLDESEGADKPCQFSFTSWRVNDYDLQIQHNEAVELACEYLGVTRMRTDTYFDGTRGKALVKIVPFNHPLTPLDIEDVNTELKRRPDEARDVTLVCLGIELAAKETVDKHNRNRPINRFHVIELRTDKNYGGFIRHEPLSAKVAVKRKDDKLTVEVKDVISPTILKRLDMEQGVFRAKIPDWRAVVDCILIDPDYDEKVFNVALADVPAKRTDFVAGNYELPAPRKGATVAVKIIDMLGEETLVTTTP